LGDRLQQVQVSFLRESVCLSGIAAGTTKRTGIQIVVVSAIVRGGGEGENRPFVLHRKRHLVEVAAVATEQSMRTELPQLTCLDR